MIGVTIKKANKTTEFTNQDASKLVASTGSGKDLREFANNAAAVAAGLGVGDLYTTTGAVMIVTA
jgi:hypothetical protein